VTTAPDRPAPSGPIDPGRRRSLEAPHRRTAAAPRIVEKAAVIGYRATEWLLGRLPTGPAAMVLGWFTQASYLLWPQKRRWVNRNFGHVLGLPPGDPAVRRMALRAYRSYARYLVELMQVPGLSRERAAALVAPEGIDAVERVWRGSNGVIFAACHVGNNEAILAGIGLRGWPLSGVADDSTFPELFEHLRRERARLGATVIPWRNLREVYGVLRRHEMLALLVDWGYRREDVPVRLFGAWTTLPAGPATLAGKTGALILPVVARRLADGTFLAATDTPIAVGSTSPPDILRATQQVADALGRVIGAAPDQWYSFKPMWPDTVAESAELEARAARMAAG
jgi:KDO2-lipid IV(A) lauroyltransferase